MKSDDSIPEDVIPNFAAPERAEWLRLYSFLRLQPYFDPARDFKTLSDHVCAVFGAEQFERRGIPAVAAMFLGKAKKTAEDLGLTPESHGPRLAQWKETGR